ncbi:MAG: Spy/CpxP family protein refolding chaperone [Gemmatimonadaceae bacterium]
MHLPIRLIALFSFAAAGTAVAQSPARPAAPAARAAGAPAAKLLLSHTGELELTDAQVVRLAAIERRSHARRKALRATMDSAGRRFAGQPGDSVARRQFRQRMQADLQRAQEQSRVDQRDAIAVLTPDQQARAWELVSNRGRSMRAGRAGGRGMGGGRAMRERRPMREPRLRDERGDMRPDAFRRPARQPRAPRPSLDG